MLSDSKKKIIDQNKTRLTQIIKFVEFCGAQERISKKQDGSLVGRTPSFRCENSQLCTHKLCAFLDYSNHMQFFLFKAFDSITSAPPLGKSWLRPSLRSNERQIKTLSKNLNNICICFRNDYIF